MCSFYQRFSPYFLVLLFLVLSHFWVAGQIRSAAIHDTLPPALFDQLSGYTKQPPNSSRAQPKAILLDFWATYCAPCVAALPRLDTLQRQFSSNLRVVTVTQEKTFIAREVMRKVFPNGSPAFAMLDSDTLYSGYFPHQDLPHCVWINREGIIEAISDDDEVNAVRVGKFVADEPLGALNKTPLLTVNKSKPAFASGQVPENPTLRYHSLITGYRDDLAPAYSRGKNYITCLNSSLARLFQCAYGKFDLSYWDFGRIICQGNFSEADSVTLGFTSDRKISKQWHDRVRDLAFSYELAFKDSVCSNDELFTLMQGDLNRYFGLLGFSAHVEKRDRPVLALEQMGDSARYKGNDSASRHYAGPHFMKIQNEPIMFFLSQIQPFLESLQLPLINETGYTGKVSLTLNEDITTLASLNHALQTSGLVVKEKTRPMEMIVIQKTK